MYVPHDHDAQNAQNCSEGIGKRVQRGNGARAEILRGVAGEVNECACVFWGESVNPL